MNGHEMTREVRLYRWAELLREQKASGESINAWCEREGIHRHQYFYWQRKLREAACSLAEREMTVAQAPEGWALCTAAAPREKTGATPPLDTAGQVCIEISGMRILAGQEYPEDKLARLLRELSGAC